jgi:hypothetical protein
MRGKFVIVRFMIRWLGVEMYILDDLEKIESELLF